jgi:hypothetical protein
MGFQSIALLQHSDISVLHRSTTPSLQSFLPHRCIAKNANTLAALKTLFSETRS